MNAVAELTDEPRLYSRPSKHPVDVIAPQHQIVHGYLEAWGRWNRSRREPGRAASAEGRYDASAGREVKRPIVALPPNPMHQRVNRAVLTMPLQHSETVKLFYVHRREPTYICRMVTIRWQDFPKWMFDCRAMVINLLRRDGFE